MKIQSEWYIVYVLQKRSPGCLFFVSCVNARQTWSITPVLLKYFKHVSFICCISKLLFAEIKRRVFAQSNSAFLRSQTPRFCAVNWLRIFAQSNFAFLRSQTPHFCDVFTCAFVGLLSSYRTYVFVFRALLLDRIRTLWAETQPPVQTTCCLNYIQPDVIGCWKWRKTNGSFWDQHVLDRKTNKQVKRILISC